VEVSPFFVVGAKRRGGKRLKGKEMIGERENTREEKVL